MLPEKDRIPIDRLAEMDYDKSPLLFGVVPLVILAILVIAGVGLYFFRRGKNWNEEGEALRANEPEPPGEGVGLGDQPSAFRDGEFKTASPTPPTGPGPTSRNQP